MTLLKTKSSPEIQAFIKERIGAALEISVNTMNIDQNIETFGLDSIMSVHITAELSTWVNKSLDPTLFFKYNTIRKSADYVSEILNK